MCLSILIWLSIELIYFLFKTHPATSLSFLFLGIFCYNYFAKVTHGLPGSQTHDYRCKDFGTHYTNPGVIDFVRCNCQSTTWELLSYGTLLTSYFFLISVIIQCTLLVIIPIRDLLSGTSDCNHAFLETSFCTGRGFLTILLFTLLIA